jgi:Mrp family chromosome partitioning ATPase
VSKIYVKSENNFWGPISQPEFVSLARSGAISKTDYILNSFRFEWQKIEDLRSLKAIFLPELMFKKPKIIAVGGNKGGVGKTLFAASLSLALSKQSKKVLAIDTDFSDPDLNEWLNVKQPSKTLCHFFDKRVKGLHELIHETSYPNLSIICGDAKTLQTSNPRFYQRSMLANQLIRQNFDFVVLDQSPGISYSSIDFFLNSDEQILVTVPEPSAILSTFRFLRMALFRKLKTAFVNNQVVLDKIKQFESPFWHQSYAPLYNLYLNLNQWHYDN